MLVVHDQPRAEAAVRRVGHPALRALLFVARGVQHPALPLPSGLGARSPPARTRAKRSGRASAFVAQTLACTVAALALLGDAILGLLLQLPVLLIACIPGVARLHHFSLLGLTQSKMANLSKMTNDPALLARNAPALLPYASHFDVAHGASDISVERMGASGLFEGHSSGGWRCRQQARGDLVHQAQDQLGDLMVRIHTLITTLFS